MALENSGLPSIRDRVSEVEWALRVDLAAAYRLVALYGWDDLIFTHLSVRVPGPEHHFLMNPQMLMFEEMTASDLVKIDSDGNKVMDTPGSIIRAGFVIHSAIHSARADAMAVIHLHTPYGQAVSGMADGLLPLTQTAMLVQHDLAYHDFEGIATDLEERERIVSDLGIKHSLVLRNHGMLTVGETIPQAFLRMYFLERACEAQVLMLNAGPRGLNHPHQEAADKVARQSTSPAVATVADQLAWPALRRKLDRHNPGYQV